METTKESKHSQYPTSTVISNYLLLGGLVAGLLFMVTVVATLLYQYFKWGGSWNLFFSLLMVIPVAVTIGSPLALLIGVVVALTRTKIRSRLSLFKIFVIGFFFSFCYFGFISIRAIFEPGEYNFIEYFITEMQFDTGKDWLKYFILYCVIGGLSSAIVGWWSVPKIKSDKSNKN